MEKVRVEGIMKLSKSIFVLSFLVLATTQIFSQSKALSEGKSSVLIDKNKPAVYLEFVKTGKCIEEPSNFNYGNLCNSKSEFARPFDAFWVRLVNNTRWAIGLTVDKGATQANATVITVDSTAFVDDDGETKFIGKMLANNRAEMDVVYKAESETGCDFNEKAPKGQSCKRRETTVPEIPLPPISSDLFVASGESIVFPVDFKHIKKYVNLYILYNFEWEYSGKNFSHVPGWDLQHRAYFGWFDLEKGIKQEEENKQKKNIAGIIK